MNFSKVGGVSKSKFNEEHILFNRQGARCEKFRFPALLLKFKVWHIQIFFRETWKLFLDNEEVERTNELNQDCFQTCKHTMFGFDIHLYIILRWNRKTLKFWNSWPTHCLRKTSIKWYSRLVRVLYILILIFPIERSRSDRSREECYHVHAMIH